MGPLRTCLVLVVTFLGICRGHVNNCEGFDTSTLDPGNAADYCHFQIASKNYPKEGQVCLAHPENVLPSQAVYGEVMSECIRFVLEKLAEKKDGSLKKYLMYKQAPAVLGPNGTIYITDHHHLAAALLRAFLDYAHPKRHRTLYVCVTRDMRDLAQDEFWSRMLGLGLAWLHDERGNEIDIRQLPRSIKFLHDDPYRTLAHYMRKSFAFIKCGKQNEDKLFPQCKDGKTRAAPFIELRWADLYRQHFSYSDIYTESDQGQVKAFRGVMQQVLDFSLSPNNRNMTGFNERKPQMAEPVTLNKYGCVVDDKGVLEELQLFFEEHVEIEAGNASVVVDMDMDLTLPVLV